METKRKIRSEKMQLRLFQKQSEAMEKSRIICEKILADPLYVEASHVLCYAAIRGEVDLTMVARDALVKGKRLYFPRVSGDEMDFHEVYTLDQLKPGTFKVFEPTEDCPKISAEGLAEGLTLVPGVAFTAEGDRIGYGKGYYDRYLSRHRGLYPIGVAYEMQLDSWKADPLDYKMTKIVTEKR